ncbi:hypothetical protein SAMN05518684_106152 [Salipaludibacillus aurantiacus]|uniref:Uncharacterized protein n=2 Tax=Salipaludibacillus aurantiacus TaxID=1601833 RepID=A0A1H9TYN0_9BACI|nr:hypothetical protein SAMN05518684_106152 [Salipaludibacillus aurantiacus]
MEVLRIMNRMSMRELYTVEDEVRAEEITAKTLNWCASQCNDEEIRRLLEELAEQHQLQVAEIAKYFNNSGLTQ